MYKHYTASPSQKLIYVSDYILNSNTSYNLSWVSIIKGKLNKEKLEVAFSELVKRHESLRTHFELISGELYQCVNNFVEFKINYKQVEPFNIEKEDIVIESIVKGFIKPFNLSDSSLFRVGLYKLFDDKHVLLIDMHHIIGDGVSLKIILREFSQLYQNNILTSQDIQYKDFSFWQEQMLQTNYMDKQRQYWKNALKGDIPVLNLPLDYPRTSERKFEGDVFNFRIGKVMTNNIKNLLSKYKVTMFMFLAAVYNVLISRYSNQDDVIIGVPTAGRVHSELSNIVGMFVNTLAIRNFPKLDLSFEEFLKNVKENSLNAFDNQEYPFEAIIEELNIKRDSARNLVFDVSFVMQNLDLDDIEIEGLTISTYKFTKNTSKFDLTLYAFEKNDEVNLSIEFSTALFKMSTIKQMGQHFLNIIKTILEKPDILLGDIDILTEVEKNKIHFEFNNTDAQYSKHKTIQQIFEEQVEKTPNAVAVISDNKSLTYFELNSRANSLARILREKGVSRNSIVGIICERSCEMIISILAIFKAGGAYLPISPNYPMERIKFILEDSNTCLVLSQNSFQYSIGLTDRILNIDDGSLYELSTENLNCINSAKDLSYVIYTSGSTGIPKGVMIEHQSLNNRLNWMKKKYMFNSSDIIIQKTPYTFDVSVWELLLWMYCGASVYFLKSEAEKDPNIILRSIQKIGASTIHFVPSMLKLFLDYLEEEPDIRIPSTLKRVFSSGEALNSNLVNRFNKLFFKSGTRLHNLYGPTEATIDVTYFDCTDDKEYNIIPIGKPIDNTKLYVLNNYLKLQPIGVSGELFIAGDGVARGYLNRDDLTAEKFIKNPFNLGERLYRTGDLGKWTPDGNIEFLGRIDHQVKIRGFRIELGEIEAKLLQHPHIKEAVVIERENSQMEKYLYTYLVMTKNLTVLELKAHLGSSLPEYMIPDYFIITEKLPLTQNGKLDRNSLLKLEHNISLGSTFASPTNEIEYLLVSLWKDILMVKEIGINDNFFDLGGNSLKAITLISRVNKILKVKLQVSDIFKRPTISGLATLLPELSGKEYIPIKPVGKKDFYPLTFAQKRMYLLNKIDSSSINYNMPRAMLIKGKLDLNKLNEAFNYVINRHDILRTNFDIVEGEIVQYVNEVINFNIEVSMIENNIVDSLNEADLINKTINEFIIPFDLKLGPLIRAKIVMLSIDVHLLAIDMHHIISDGVSLGVFINEIQKTYNGNTLPDMYLQYKDYAVWQNELFKPNFLKEQESYWLNVYSDEIPKLNLPTDYQRPSLQSFKGDKFVFELDEDITEELYSIAKRQKCTIFTVLIAVYSILLSKYSGQDDIIIGTITAGRNQAELENVIGMFVNTLALRLHPKGEISFAKYMGIIREDSLAAFDNQDIQFDYLIDKLKLKKDLSRNPLFDTMFVLQNMEYSEIDIEHGQIECIDISTNTSKFDILMQAIPLKKKLFFEIEYCVDLFKRETIVQFASHYKNIVNAIIKNNNIKIDDIDILTSEEKHKLLYEFNSTNLVGQVNKSIHEIFEEQAEMTPDNIAVISEHEELTYKVLNERANCIARKLINNGIKRNSIVGVMAVQSIETIVGILGILKSGGAYLPINPDYPKSRIEYILKDSNAEAFLISEDLIETIDLDISIINISDYRLFRLNNRNIDKVHSSNEDLAYVIYTSGTTGTPKGVMIEHKSVVNLAVSQTNLFNITEKDRILQFSPISFDASVEQIFISLLSGASLYLISKNIMLNSKRFEEFLIASRITHLNAVPAFLDNINIKGTHSLKRIVSGGDICLKSLAEKWYKECDFYNQYGPTEATVTSTSYLVTNLEPRQNQILIGRPIYNTNIYILDSKKSLLPIGVIGEVYISGIGIARGYLNNKKLTDEKFVENPFIKGERMYKTGDLAKWRSDGNIEYVGRVDSQVKIRGYRIEINEIEIQLRKIENIKDAIVIDKVNSEGYRFLCAYVIVNGELTTSKIRERLMLVLPEYMIPSYFIQVERFPLLHNGKVDKSSLPEFDLTLDVVEDSNPPATELEDKIAKVWRKVLNVNNVGTNNDFFDLGGNSLLAVKLQVELEKNMIDVQIKDIYNYRTIKEFANFLSGGQAKSEILLETNSLVEIESQEAIIIKDIEPFNELFYRNCFFNLAIVILKHFKCNILTLLTNDVIKYVYFKNHISSIDVEYISNTNIERIMEMEGIGVEIKKGCKSIADEIIFALDNQRPIIICIDSYFYKSVYSNEVEKKHWIHYLLVYGYDDKRKLFYVIEQKHQNNLSYEKRKMSYDDLVNSYYGYNGQEASYYEFYRLDENKFEKLQEQTNNSKSFYLKNHFNSENDIVRGAESLLDFKNDLGNIIGNESSMEEYIEKLIENMNSLINAKKVERYTFNKLFEDKENLLECIDNIVESWSNLRVFLAKYMYSKILNTSQINEKLSNIDSIYENEQKIIEILSKI